MSERTGMFAPALGRCLNHRLGAAAREGGVMASSLSPLELERARRNGGWAALGRLVDELEPTEQRPNLRLVVEEDDA